ncbi:hypothetical protein D3C83_287800 [compost metagenome]
MLFTLIAIVCAVWAIILMYRAFSVSCNLRGPRAVIPFIVAMLLAEIATKSLIYFYMVNT